MRASDKVHLELSRREHDVLWALSLGLIEKEVAVRLGVSASTVRVYRIRVQRKLGTRCLAQSIIVAWKLGMLDLDALANEIAVLNRGERGAAAPADEHEEPHPRTAPFRGREETERIGEP